MAVATRKRNQVAGARARARTARRGAYDRKIVGSFFMGEPIGAHFLRKSRKSKFTGKSILNLNIPKDIQDRNDPTYLKTVAPFEGLHRYVEINSELLINHFNKEIVKEYFFFLDKTIRDCVDKQEKTIRNIFNYSIHKDILPEKPVRGDASSIKESIRFLYTVIRKEKKLKLKEDNDKLFTVASNLMDCIIKFLHNKEEITKQINDIITENKVDSMNNNDIIKMMGRMTV